MAEWNEKDRDMHPEGGTRQQPCFCQSCGMPMTATAQYGTEKDDGISADYCSYCYGEGAFRQPDITMDGMVKLCAHYLVEEGMEEGQAVALVSEQLPGLKRWSAAS